MLEIFSQLPELIREKWQFFTHISLLDHNAFICVRISTQIEKLFNYSYLRSSGQTMYRSRSSSFSEDGTQYFDVFKMELPKNMTTKAWRVAGFRWHCIHPLSVISIFLLIFIPYINQIEFNIFLCIPFCNFIYNISALSIYSALSLKLISFRSLSFLLGGCCIMLVENLSGTNKKFSNICSSVYSSTWTILQNSWSKLN